ncbi:MAG: pseudaminic acid synthase [Candidatus Andersenbacteria bacterium]|nr:pseudaminic acid synthase [Candidatus Andersenbacteria bacterium]
MAELSIGQRVIGPGRPVYFVAELSGNHHRDYAEAERLIRAAKEAGADAIKSQVYTPDTITVNASSEPYLIRGTNEAWDGKTLYQLYGEAYTTWEWLPKMKELSNRLGMDFFASVFDETAVDWLEREVGVPVHKIASFEIVDIPLIEHAARTGRPMIISTGMASLSEIEEAVAAARRAGASQVGLLKCTSAYPSPASAMNLQAIPYLAAAFQAPVGLSDHTLGIAVPIAAVAYGACFIEKHLTLSRAVPGPDSAFSVEPDEFKAMVEAVRVAEQARGEVRFGAADVERSSIVFRPSLVVTRDIKAGELFTRENVDTRRPGYGLPPKFLGEVLGRIAMLDLPLGTPLDWPYVGAPAEGMEAVREVTAGSAPGRDRWHMTFGGKP